MGKKPDATTEDEAKLAGDIAKGNAIASADLAGTVGLGISKPLPLKSAPEVAGNIISSITTECANDQAGKVLSDENEKFSL